MSIQVVQIDETGYNIFAECTKCSYIKSTLSTAFPSPLSTTVPTLKVITSLINRPLRIVERVGQEEAGMDNRKRGGVGQAGKVLGKSVRDRTHQSELRKTKTG